MKKVAFIGLCLLISSCSWVLDGGVPYAEDIDPATLTRVEKEAVITPAERITAIEKEKSDDIVYKERIITPIEKATVIKEKEVVIPAEKITEVKEEVIVKDEARPVVKDITTDSFPRIKDIPETPKNFPTNEEIVAEKENLLEKVSIISSEQTITSNIPFTGFDDELLLYTISEIEQNELPIEYKTKRPLLSTSITEEISYKDLEALELIVKDRAKNIKPLIILFYGGNNAFQQETIATLLLLGLDPSLIYIQNIESKSLRKAEISLYY